MSTKTVSTDKKAVIEHRDQLVQSFARGEKPKERWRIGTEHEKFVYSLSDHHAPSYDEPGGIRDLLMALTEFGWKPVEEGGPVSEGGRVIALSGVDGAISLEPASTERCKRAFRRAPQRKSSTISGDAPSRASTIAAPSRS